MLLRQKTLLYTIKGETPTPPGPGPTPGGYQLLYLMNGDNSSSTKVQNWSINTGIVWRDVFVNSSSLGISRPGLETVITYCYTYGSGHPEGGMFAGCNPRYKQAGGGGGRDMGGFWRIFGYSSQNFSFDCPSEDDRLGLGNETLQAGWIFTETCKYGYLGSNSLNSYLKVETPNVIGGVMGEATKTSFVYSWADAALPHNLYLWADASQSSGDVAPRGGVKIYGFTVYYLENGVRHTKVYDGVPWMDGNNVPCIYDSVSNTLQYNCASNPLPFLYGTIS